MGFRGGTKTFCWVIESPRLLLLILEVKRKKLKRPPSHSTMMYLLREMIGMILTNMLQVTLTWRKNFPRMKENHQQFRTRTSVQPSAISQEKPSAIPATIIHKKFSSFPQEDAKNDDDIAEDERKPGAIQQEEILTTQVAGQPIHNIIPSLPSITDKVLP
jgi:hypothetical protein